MSIGELQTMKEMCRAKSKIKEFMSSKSTLKRQASRGEYIASVDESRILGDTIERSLMNVSVTLGGHAGVQFLVDIGERFSVMHKNTLCRLRGYLWERLEVLS